MAPTPPAAVTPTSGGKPVTPAPVIARYDGVLSLSIERSQFVIVDEERARANRARFESTPVFSSAPDPPADAGLRELLIARLLSVFEFGAGLAAMSLPELETALDERWGTIAEVRRTRALGRPTDTYERVAVEGLVRADGTAEWGYTFGSAGKALPMPRQALAVSGVPAARSDYEQYIQNQARADLMRLST